MWHKWFHFLWKLPNHCMIKVLMSINCWTIVWIKAHLSILFLTLLINVVGMRKNHALTAGCFASLSTRLHKYGSCQILFYYVYVSSLIIGTTCMSHWKGRNIYCLSLSSRPTCIYVLLNGKLLESFFCTQNKVLFNINFHQFRYL